MEKEPVIKDDMIDEDDDGEEEEEEEVEITQEQLDENLLKACKDNNIEDAEFWLSKGSNPCYEKDNWNPLLWASCHGNETIVRFLLKEGACRPYIN